MKKMKFPQSMVVVLTIPFLLGCEVVGFIYPPMRIYLREIDGRASLAEAEHNRKIKVLEAQAKMDSAKLESMAEVERAKGVAEANKIIGTSLQGNESYLKYLWINGLSEGKNQVIYVPTEASLPILESTRGSRP